MVTLGKLDNLTMAEQSLAEEAEAINAYTARLSMAVNVPLRGIIKANLIEESEHAGSFNRWIFSFTDKDTSIRSNLRENAAVILDRTNTPLTMAFNSDVVIAQDALREEERACRGYQFKLDNIHQSAHGGAELYTLIRDDVLPDELKHAFNLFNWLRIYNPRWHEFIEHSDLAHMTRFRVSDLKMLDKQLNSFMPSFQEEWAPWWGPKPVSGSSTKTSRTSRGGPSGGREKTSYIKGLQATNLSINMEPLQRWFSNTDTIQTQWRKVRVKKQVWDPAAYDPTFHRQGAIVTVDEEMMVPPPQFVRRWGRRIVLERPSGIYRIDAGSTGKKGYAGNYLVTLWIAPRMTTAGQTYNLREQEYAMLYKKDMTIEECERKTDELIRIIQGLW